MTNKTWMTLAAVAALFFAGLGHVALLDPDEGRYAVTAREMLASADWVVPSFNGEPRLNKPPLLYWLIAASFAILPQTEAAARLPSSLAALLTVLLAGWWAGRRLGPACRTPAMLALAAAPLFFACARLAITDMLLTLFTTAALILWDEAVCAPSALWRRLYAAAASAAGGLAFLAKGPVGPLLAALVILVTSLIERRPGLVTKRGSVAAAAGLLFVAGPWCALLSARLGFDGALAILRRESLDRALTGLDHPRPFWYLLATFWPLFFPWSLAMPAALRRAMRARGAEAGPVRFLSIWLLVPILFFTLLPGKNDAYLLPVAPAVALLTAWRMRGRGAIALSCAMGIALVSAVFVFGEGLSERRSIKSPAVWAWLAYRGEMNLLCYKLYKPTLAYYANHPAQWLISEAELAEALRSAPKDRPTLILMTGRRYQQVRGMLDGFRVASMRGDYVVLFSP